MNLEAASQSSLEELLEKLEKFPQATVQNLYVSILWWVVAVIANKNQGFIKLSKRLPFVGIPTDFKITLINIDQKEGH